MSAEKAALFRQRAEDMERKAAEAKWPEMRRAWLLLARDWMLMAQKEDEKVRASAMLQQLELVIGEGASSQ